jgi:hypothetical protein
MGLMEEMQQAKMREDKPHGPTGLETLGVEMDETTRLEKLAAALAKAQASMEHADPSRTAAVTKDGSKRRKYATLADVMDAARPHLAANGLCVVQHPTTGSGSIILTTWLIHESGQWMRSRMEFPRPDSQQMSLIQALGTALSYARRYAYAAIVGVAVEDDDGEGAERPTGRREEERDEAPTHFPNFGPAKGEAIRGAELRHLEVYAEAMRKALADPERERFKASNRALLGAIETEIARLATMGAPAAVEAAKENAAPGAPVYDQAMAFLKGAEAPGKVDEALRRAKAKVTSIEFAALETVGRQRKEALARLRERELSEGERDAMRHEENPPPPGDDDAPF